MRHSNAGRKLGRSSSHRKALFRNMAKALLTYGRITTTEAKAKELRHVVEPLITLGMKDDVHARREAYRKLGSHQLVKRLFDEVAPAFAGVAGGYTRVLKLSQPRKGDSAPLAVIELTHGAPSLTPELKSSKKTESGEEKAKQPKAATPKAPRAPKSAAMKAPKSAPKAQAPKKLKIGGE